MRPLRAIPFPKSGQEDAEVLVGVWFGSLQIDARSLAAATNLQVAPVLHNLRRNTSTTSPSTTERRGSGLVPQQFSLDQQATASFYPAAPVTPRRVMACEQSSRPKIGHGGFGDELE